MKIWADPAETTFFAFPFGQSSGIAYVVEVDGERLVFIGGTTPEATPADKAAIDAIIASMTFEKAAPTASG